MALVGVSVGRSSCREMGTEAVIPNCNDEEFQVLRMTASVWRLEEDVAGFGDDGHSDADFASALIDADEHDVHNSDVSNY